MANNYTAQQSTLAKLACKPPQTILLEGGCEQARFDLALFWAKCLNCPTAFNNQLSFAEPCLECNICSQIDALEYFDLIVFDGRISNKEDEEKPGPVRAMRMSNMNELKQVLGTKPRGDKKRVVIFQGMTQTREEAMNSLLKTLEEPALDTHFVLLVPQRQQILPTLVSRSFCITLPWLGIESKSAEITELEKGLADFLKTGQGFLTSIASKGSFDTIKASHLISSCQNALAQVLETPDSKNSLIQAFSKFAANPKLLFLVSQWLCEAQEMLTGNVNPVRVFESLSTRLHMIIK